MKKLVHLLEVAAVVGSLAVATHAQAQAPATTAAVVPAPTGYELDSKAKRMKYREGYPVPDGYVVIKRPLRGLLISGIVVAGVPYLTGIVITATYGFSNSGALLAIPVAGPWLHLALRSGGCWGNVCPTLLPVDGGLQAIGLAMGIMGAVFTRTELVRADLATVSILPTQMGRDSYGLAAIGTF